MLDVDTNDPPIPPPLSSFTTADPANDCNLFGETAIIAGRISSTSLLDTALTVAPIASGVDADTTVWFIPLTTSNPAIAVSSAITGLGISSTRLTPDGLFVIKLTPPPTTSLLFTAPSIS